MVKFEAAAFEFAAGKLNQLPPSDVPEIVFSGKSNVGKSSLINKILNRKALARVSATPGKTGTINFYNIQGARLVDLPGYGYAKVSQSESFAGPTWWKGTWLRIGIFSVSCKLWIYGISLRKMICI